MHTIGVGRDVTVLTTPFPIPGIGVLPVNAFLLRAAEPVVVDTGVGVPGTGFLDTLATLIDPADVRWIWLTHPDRDHTGGLFDLLEAAPEAKVVTTFLGVGIMSTERPLPLDRVHLVNPGQALDVGDRRLFAFRPPLFDNPATTGFFDPRSRACFSSDCFGAPMASEEQALSTDVAAVGDDDLHAGQMLWASVDSPWVHSVDQDRFAESLRPLREMDAAMVLSSHLPPAVGRTESLIDSLARTPEATPFVGPDQQALEALLAGFEPGGAASDE